MRYTVSVLVNPIAGWVEPVGQFETLAAARKAAGKFGTIFDHDTRRFVR